MPTFYDLSSAQLRQALRLREQIETLQGKLTAILGTTAAPAASSPEKAKRTGGQTKGKRIMSNEARAKIAAAAKARWARTKGNTAASPKASTRTSKKKSGLTAEGRARLSESMKARWAARKKGAAAPNASAS